MPQPSKPPTNLRNMRFFYGWYVSKFLPINVHNSCINFPCVFFFFAQMKSEIQAARTNTDSGIRSFLSCVNFLTICHKSRNLFFSFSHRQFGHSCKIFQLFEILFLFLQKATFYLSPKYRLSFLLNDPQKGVHVFF